MAGSPNALGWLLDYTLFYPKQISFFLFCICLFTMWCHPKWRCRTKNILSTMYSVTSSDYTWNYIIFMIINKTWAYCAQRNKLKAKAEVLWYSACFAYSETRLIPGITYDPFNPLVVISEHKVRSKIWTYLRATQIQ